jgi:hypothetical protein
MPKNDKQPDLLALDALLGHASDCDKHAAALCESVRQLYNGVSEARTRNNNRGVTGLVVHSSVERLFARYAAGTPLSRMRRGAHPSFTSFRRQVEMWLPSLTTPAPLPAVPPPPPSADKRAA